MTNPDRLAYRESYRRTLPHIVPPGGTYFLTLRLAGTLPLGLVNAYRSAKEEWRQYGISGDLLLQEKRQWFKRIDRCLDQGKEGVDWLRDERIAQLIFDALLHRHQKIYDLECFCIMPNHLHLVFHHLVEQEGANETELKRKTIQGILHSFKRFTARKANAILGRKGKFWANESFDHLVRSRESLLQIIRYVLDNPVKAGLVREWTEWRWTWLNSRYKEVYCAVDPVPEPTNDGTEHQ